MPVIRNGICAAIYKSQPRLIKGAENLAIRPEREGYQLCRSWKHW
ncbi:hypothetical protein PMF13cell1_00662 [Blautia producta]|uniref:Uncharacterized protein n=1 Tax=Blautia producta TaxID=33035 RepID=A0A4P6LT75_9FIRM|nr:hypothetical protein PMF13cell1_00662 [Blautia producta]